MKIGKIVIIASAIVLLCGCHKAVLDCQYTVVTRYQRFDKIWRLIEADTIVKTPKDSIIKADTIQVVCPDTIIKNVAAYAYFGDTAQLKIMSADDARLGVITDRVTGERRDFDLKAVMSDDGSRASFQIKQVPVILSVYDPLSGSWAWRYAAVDADLPRISVVLRFRLWNWDKTPLVENRWIVNIPTQSITVDPRPEPPIAPKK